MKFPVIVRERPGPPPSEAASGYRRAGVLATSPACTMWDPGGAFGLYKGWLTFRALVVSLVTLVEQQTNCPIGRGVAGRALGKCAC